MIIILISIVNAQISTDIEAIKERVIEVACTILVIIEGIVGFIAVLMFILAGIKWIISEDPHERAEVKEKLVHIIVGVIIVILALEIANVIGKAVKIIEENQTCGMVDVASTKPIRDIIGGPICIVVRVFQALFGIIGMIVFMIAGIKWMTSESAEERVKARRIAINVIVGILIFIIGLQFLGVLFNISDSGLNYGFELKDLVNFSCSGFETDLGKLPDFVKYTLCMIFLIIKGIAGIVAVLMVVIAGIILIVSENASLRNKAKGLAVAAVIGTIIIIIGGEFLFQLFDLDKITDVDKTSSFTCDYDVPKDITDLINYTLCTIIKVFQAIAALIAVIAVMASAFIWITSESPEARVSAKMTTIVAILGLLVVIIGLKFLGTFFGSDFLSFECGVGEEPSDIITLINNVLCLIFNILRSVIAIIAAIMILFGGFMFITSESASGRTRGKNIIASAIIGFIIALIALQFIQTIIAGYDLADISCDDEYKKCIDKCAEKEPSPITGGGGGTVTTTSTITSTSTTTTPLQSCIEICASVGNCQNAPYNCGRESYCIKPEANCNINQGIPEACNPDDTTYYQLEHHPEGDEDCENRYGQGYQCCCCPPQ